MSTIEKALQKKKALKQEQLEANATKAAEAEVSDESGVASAQKSETVTEPAQTETTPAPVNKDTVNNFIDLVNTQKDGFVSEEGRNIINEEFRVIKRKVLNNAFGPLAKTLTNSNIVMVTSPNPNEGKTFTAINLALSIAMEKDKTVLLVDADVLRPSVMKTVDQPFENGLMEYLLGEVDDLGKVMYRTSLETLRIIPAGKTHHLSTELLASEKMLETVTEFATRYPDRVVIFDTPPLLGINETAILANLAGQGVVVVQEGKTSLTRLSQAVDQLSPDMAKGFVINKATHKSTDSVGYYGYYYGEEKE